jgi:hypothetical protein
MYRLVISNSNRSGDRTVTVTGQKERAQTLINDE